MRKFIIIICVLNIFPFLEPNQSFAEIRPRKEYEKTGQVFWEAHTTDKKVAITFDDGPNSIYTPIVLEVLNEYDAKATFFVVGNMVEKHPDIVSNIVYNGHELGNHTFSHAYGQSVSEEELLEEIEKTNSILQLVIGSRPSYFRPVGGYYSDEVIDSAVQLNHKVLLWSWHQDPKDWSDQKAAQIANHVTQNIRPGDVILLHDGGGNRMETVLALKLILPILKDEGYRFVTASELFAE
ncbi:polysaccharide deacetylase family protein [Sutcliffiella rhizosphaerae]|uniref:Peptidoglycan-N-acetylglucosamine deacetylase n=1 Tax=Sutcliffiella rhizosphaerae TaxID=2880967 RepID=A0ABN8A9K6_9BACI|nr:polysaccharide deacetylase family protein [Sutcliffiella rhizosphaerae]CAG9621838.1 Peptidoglycan-N-acetylglucosamine deacetylase [Sutcliffiella rhizosphaerae]